jgi:hypothetical protein
MIVLSVENMLVVPIESIAGFDHYGVNLKGTPASVSGSWRQSTARTNVPDRACDLWCTPIRHSNWAGRLWEGRLWERVFARHALTVVGTRYSIAPPKQSDCLRSNSSTQEDVDYPLGG